MGRRQREKGKLTVRESIIAILSAKGFATLDLLEEKTGYNKDLLKVTLSNMVKQGVVTRRWMKYGGKKFRVYILKNREELVS